MPEVDSMILHSSLILVIGSLAVFKTLRSSSDTPEKIEEEFKFRFSLLTFNLSSDFRLWFVASTDFLFKALRLSLIKES